MRNALLVLLIAGMAQIVAAGQVDVLVYTRWQWVKNQKTGEVVAKGAYHHASTEQGAEEVRRYFTANGLTCRVTDDPAFFTSDAMKKLKCIVLCNCNHELFAADAQREAFYSFVKNGGGLLAIHSSSACERGSKRFRDFLGGSFERHYGKHQAVPFRHADRSHPAIACLPKGYVWADDEIYLNHPDEEHVRPLLVLDWNDVLEESRKTDKWGCPKSGGHVLEWCKTYGKGRIYYTALGHNAKDWGKTEWQLHLLEAARWTMGEGPEGKDSAR